MTAGPDMTDVEATGRDMSGAGALGVLAPGAPVTGAQVRMARAAVKWTVSDLAERAGLPWARLQQVERADGVPSAKEEVLVALRSALEAEGVIFLSGTAGDGVVLRPGRA